MKQKLCFLLLLCPFFGIGMQAKNIGIGDRVPDILINSVLNYPARSLRLSELKGKVVILDFWATSCGSCINNLPRLDSLQRSFGSSAVILAVTYEKAAVVQAFLRRNPVGKQLVLPVVTDDVVLSGLFPHQVISHEVWIDKNGVVAAITEPEYVDARNIGALADARMIDLPVKTDIAGYDYHRPLFSAPGVKYYSAVGAYKNGVQPKVGLERDTAAHKTRMYVVNSSILDLYLLALHQPFNLPASYRQIRVRDQERIYTPAGTYQNSWNQENAFCYESVLPDSLSITARKEAMRSDLDQFFRMKGTMETKNVRCLSLQWLPGAKLPAASRDSIPVNTLHSKDPVKVLKDGKLAELVWELDNLPGGLPVVDETGFGENVDLRLAVPALSNTAALNAALRPYGLVLQEVFRPLRLFVLSDDGVQNH